MAYYSDDEEEQGAGGAQTGSGAISKPGSGIVSGGTTGGQGKTAAAPVEAAKQSTPGNSASPFFGIKEYLNANKQQSGKLGGQVGGFVNQKIDTANTALQGAGQNFANQVDQNTVKLDEGLLNEIKADPTKVAADQAKLAQAKNMQKGYAGPTDFQSNEAFQSVNPTLQKAQTTTENLGNAQGQKQVLTEQQLETRGGKVNRGAATLDQALLQASPEAREALKPTQAKGKQLKGNIDQTIQSAMNRVAGAKKASQETNEAINNLYNQQFQEQQAALNARAAKANKEVQDYNNSLKSRLYNGDLTDQDFANLGISKGDYQALRGDFEKYTPDEGFGGYSSKGLNSLANYLQFSNPQANAQNIATAEDYARAQALNQLAGFGGEYLANPALANTFNRDTVNYDLAAARNMINEKKAAAERAAAQQSGGQSGVQNAANSLDPIINAAIIGGPMGAGAAAAAGALGVGGGGGGGGGIFSDRNLKKDVKPFEAKKFLEAISQGRKSGAKHG